MAFTARGKSRLPLSVITMRAQGWHLLGQSGTFGQWSAEPVLKNISPGISRVAALWDPTTGTSQVVETKNAAQSLNVSLQILEVRNGDDLPRALEAAQSADALNVFNSPFLASLHHDIIKFAAEHRFSRLAMAYSGSSPPAPIPFLRNFSNGWTRQRWLEATGGRYA
jgi:hypothetical protein